MSKLSLGNSKLFRGTKIEWNLCFLKKPSEKNFMRINNFNNSMYSDELIRDW